MALLPSVAINKEKKKTQTLQSLVTQGIWRTKKKKKKNTTCEKILRFSPTWQLYLCATPAPIEESKKLQIKTQKENEIKKKKKKSGVLTETWRNGDFPLTHKIWKRIPYHFSSKAAASQRTVSDNGHKKILQEKPLSSLCWLLSQQEMSVL
ncbi:hypothetical protein XENTR_v10006802 [Xenopus tropicalis]|nr:hypothetical protein XENTR_v10006802 [Xenopus tropicalis]